VGAEPGGRWAVHTVVGEHWGTLPEREDREKRRLFKSDSMDSILPLISYIHWFSSDVGSVDAGSF
jgi:hypothetical protein